LLPDFAARVESGFGYRPEADQFADLQTTDRLQADLASRLPRMQPATTWPESRRTDVFEHLHLVADGLGSEHSTFLACFGGWEYLGALRMLSAGALRSAESYWNEGREAFCLLADNLEHGLFLDHTDPDQLHGEDEYELFCWGDFLPHE
jgi:hypothetical protein